MDIKNLFTLEGRANRAKYFWVLLIFNIISAMLRVMVVESRSYLISFISIIIVVIGAIICICVTVQRLHDIERSGSHYFLLFIPIYNIYLGIILLFAKGTSGRNYYGEDPLAKLKAYR